WLAGLLDRSGWQAAFTPETISAMHNARLELKKEAVIPVSASTRKEPGKIDAVPVDVVPDAPKFPEINITLEEYLDRVEGAATYYDMIGVTTTADTADIKRTYFALAKMFHPDKY